MDQVQAVITAPSRELATQIYQAARQLASHSDTEVRVTNYVGGTDKNRQIDKLQASQPHIVVGTPGRIYDLVKSGDLAIHKAKTFVVDEADMTLDMGFWKQLIRLLAACQRLAIYGLFSDHSAETPTVLKNTCPIQSWNKSRPIRSFRIPLKTG